MTIRKIQKNPPYIRSNLLVIGMNIIINLTYIELGLGLLHITNYDKAPSKYTRIFFKVLYDTRVIIFFYIKISVPLFGCD
jgi:hypothetical protein